MMSETARLGIVDSTRVGALLGIGSQAGGRLLVDRGPVASVMAGAEAMPQRCGGVEL